MGSIPAWNSSAWSRNFDPHAYGEYEVFLLKNGNFGDNPVFRIFYN